MNSFLKTIQSYDIRLAFYVTRLYHHHCLNQVMKSISASGNFGMIWLILICILWFYPPMKQAAIDMLLALIITVFIGQLTIKSIVHRKRPCQSYPQVKLLIPMPHDASFPSSHTASSFACATVLFVFSPILGIMGYIYAFLMGISRIYLFVHYLSDVISGMLLGMGIGTIFFYI